MNASEFLTKLDSDNCHYYEASFHFRNENGDYSHVITPPCIKMIYFGFEIIVLGIHVLNINDPSNWMNGKEDYSNPEVRIAKDILVKLVYFNKDKWMYRLTDDLSCHRYGIVVGGFHCVHPISIVPKGAERQMPYRVLSDFIMGNVFPNSIWSLNHRPACGPKALTYMKSDDTWISIYDNHQWEALTGERVPLFDTLKVDVDTKPSKSWSDYVEGSSLVGLNVYKSLWNSPEVPK